MSANGVPVTGLSCPSNLPWTAMTRCWVAAQELNLWVFFLGGPVRLGFYIFVYEIGFREADRQQ